jgi:glucose/arabinose dehydrogenase
VGFQSAVNSLGGRLLGFLDERARDGEVAGTHPPRPPASDGLDRYSSARATLMFPREYHGGIFSAQHGSWNRTTPVGARVMFTSLNEDGSAAETKPFAEGWLVEETGEIVGALYRLSYGE